MRRGASRESSSRHGIWREIDHLSKYGGFFDVSERVPQLGFGFSMTILYDMRELSDMRSGYAWSEQGRAKAWRWFWRAQELATACAACMPIP